MSTGNPDAIPAQGSPSHPLPSLGVPMNGQTRAQITDELEAIPRGSLAQNIYRMVYQQARLNGLGSRPEIGPTSEDAHAFALQTVREQHPDFWPTLIDGFQ